MHVGGDVSGAGTSEIRALCEVTGVSTPAEAATAALVFEAIAGVSILAPLSAAEPDARGVAVVGACQAHARSLRLRATGPTNVLRVSEKSPSVAPTSLPSDGVGYKHAFTASARSAENNRATVPGDSSSKPSSFQSSS